ncbi:MAG: alpha/beta hydrolase, partial [Rickettsiales bacterium]
APDQRGYGRTTGDTPAYDVDLAPYNMINLARDAMALLWALGHRTTAAVIGHDFGASVAAYCALIRPDVFRAVVLMSAPFSGPPEFPFDTAAAGDRESNPAGSDIFADLARLDPPRKHYHDYYSTRAADRDMTHCPQGISNFLRGYFHAKSADWAGNDPHPLAAWAAADIAVMPTYYIMERDKNMAETAAEFMPSAAEIASCAWLDQREIAFYAEEFGRTGFQGGLNWYRCRLDPAQTLSLCLFSGRTIDVPSCFIAGKKDWGVFQRPGAFEAMQARACTRMSDVHLLPGAGHWVQQEQPAAVVDALTGFLSRAA